jgi:hypothetical protein
MHLYWSYKNINSKTKLDKCNNYIENKYITFGTINCNIENYNLTKPIIFKNNYKSIIKKNKNIKLQIEFYLSNIYYSLKNDNYITLLKYNLNAILQTMRHVLNLNINNNYLHFLFK